MIAQCFNLDGKFLIQQYSADQNDKRKMKMKLSVIIPAYNLESYIAECLHSVCDQKVSFKYEILVADDASSDGTAKVIEQCVTQYPSLIKAIYKKTNQGLAENIFTLLEHAKGDYIAYMDGDDLALPGKLQVQVDYLDNHLDCSMVYHESDMFDSDSGKHIRWYSKEYYNWSYITDRSTPDHMAQNGTFMQASSVMMRNHSQIDQSVDANCQILLDYPFYLYNLLWLGGTADFIDNCYGRYRVHNNSFGSQTAKSAERREQCLNDLEHTIAQCTTLGLSQSIANKSVYNYRLATAYYFLKNNDHQRFLRFISQSSDGNYFFDERHKFVYHNQNNPTLLPTNLMSSNNSD